MSNHTSAAPPFGLTDDTNTGGQQSFINFPNQDLQNASSTQLPANNLLDAAMENDGDVSSDEWAERPDQVFVVIEIHFPAPSEQNAEINAIGVQISGIFKYMQYACDCAVAQAKKIDDLNGHQHDLDDYETAFDGPGPDGSDPIRRRWPESRWMETFDGVRLVKVSWTNGHDTIMLDEQTVYEEYSGPGREVWQRATTDRWIIRVSPAADASNSGVESA